MKTLAIDEVVVVDRHRADLGDVKALADSIREVGLLHPIVVTPDNRNKKITSWWKGESK